MVKFNENELTKILKDFDDKIGSKVTNILSYLL